MRICAIIPARYDSSRFEGKPLADINGRPMIWWVYNRLLKSNRIDKVLVATDDERISFICDFYGIEYMMTSKSHKSSTNRIYEVAKKLNEYDYYICINGDEPLIQSKIVEEIIPDTISEDLFVSNLITLIKKPSEVLDPTNIKVVFNDNLRALYMSRSPIPYPKASLDYDYYKHIGVLCYNLKGLEFFEKTKKGHLEMIEDINEIRFLENNQQILFKIIDTEVLSVDTPKDLEFIKNYLLKKGITYDNI